MNVIDDLLIASAVIWWGFVLWYAARSKWWKTKYSRNMMGVGVNTAVAYTLLGFLVTLGWQPWMLWPWIVQMVSMIFLGAMRTYYMEKVQQAAAKSS